MNYHNVTTIPVAIKQLLWKSRSQPPTAVLPLSKPDIEALSEDISDYSCTRCVSLSAIFDKKY